MNFKKLTSLSHTQAQAYSKYVLEGCGSRHCVTDAHHITVDTWHTPELWLFCWQWPLVLCYSSIMTDSTVAPVPIQTTHWQEFFLLLLLPSCFHCGCVYRHFLWGCFTKHTNWMKSGFSSYPVWIRQWLGFVKALVNTACCHGDLFWVRLTARPDEFLSV